MKERTQDRLFAACGIASVALVLGGSVIASAGGQPSYTLNSSSAHIAHELANPVGTGAWIGAYMELLSVGFFLAFAIWASAKLGGGLLGKLAGAGAISYATLNIVALAAMDALAYRAGDGIGTQLGTALANMSSALFIASWVLSAFFLLAAGPLALTSGRRILGRSAIGIAIITLVLTPALVEQGGQIGYFLWLIWIVAASLGLARGARAPAAGPVVA